MATPYYVKAYYTKQPPEIRRFAINISIENDVLRELQTKIATYQPDIQLTGYSLQYIDEDNERITFSSNEELRAAISINKESNTLKIFIVPNPTVKRNVDESQERHTGITCDGCNGPVVGARFKCCVCSDYDLCEKCSSAGLHSEHNLIKINKPGHIYHPYGARHHGRRHHRFFYPHPSSSSLPSFVPNSEMLQQIQSQIPQWLPNRENTSQMRDHLRSHMETIKNSTQTQVQNSKHYLESVGQYLQQTLSPFGVDCNYRVDEQTTSTGENATATNEPSAVPKTPSNDENGITSMMNTMHIPEATASASSTRITNPLEKNIEECVELMRDMGFDDNNRELLELIREKKGDLNSVLDAINNCQSKNE